MSMSNNDGKIKWRKTGTDEWTSSVERGVTCVITFTAPGTYTVLLDDEDDTTADLETLGIAKNFFRKYLLDKSEPE